MKTRWDDAAHKNARYYIATTAYETDAEFVTSGEYDVKKILSGLPGFNPDTDSALEIGCGIGRLLRAMSPHFARLYGVDISPEMIRLGRDWLREYPKIKLAETTGNSLHIVEDNTIDFVFSYITFQHIPSRKLIAKYMREAFRVLKPGGCFRFQTFCARSLSEVVKNRMRILLNRKSDLFAGWSWRISSLRNTVEACGFQGVEIRDKVDYEAKAPYGVGQPERHIWCTGTKPRALAARCP